MNNKKYRCYVEKRSCWYAHCIDLDINALGDSSENAITRLIVCCNRTYLERWAGPAHISHHIRYYYIKIKSFIRGVDE